MGLRESGAATGHTCPRGSRNLRYLYAEVGLALDNIICRCHGRVPSRSLRGVQVEPIAFPLSGKCFGVIQTQMCLSVSKIRPDEQAARWMNVPLQCFLISCTEVSIVQDPIFQVPHRPACQVPLCQPDRHLGIGFSLSSFVVFQAPWWISYFLAGYLLVSHRASAFSGSASSSIEVYQLASQPSSGRPVNTIRLRG